MREMEAKEIFIEAYKAHADAIFRYCYFRVYDKERAADLMQETFTKTWEYIQKGNEIDNIRAFLYRVAHNICINESVRTKPLSLDLLEEETGFEPEDRTRTPEERAEVSLLLSKLKELRPPDRDLLTLRYVDDMSVSEIAELQGQVPNTVSVRIKRALEELKSKVGQK